MESFSSIMKRRTLTLFAISVILINVRELQAQRVWSPPQVRVEQLGAMTALQDGTLILSGSRVLYSTNFGINFKPSPDTSFQDAIFLVEANGYIFAGGFVTAYRSSDRGISWQDMKIKNGLRQLTSTKSGKLIAFTTQGGLLNSIDRGSSWQPLAPPVGSSNIYSLAVDSTDVLWLGTQNGLWSSVDEGNSWKKNAVDPSDSLSNEIYQIAINNSSDIMAITGVGLFHSSLPSLHFSKVSTYNFFTTGYDTHGVFYTQMNGGGSLYVTTDQGTSWRTIYGAAQVKNFASAGGHFFAQGLNFWEVKDTGKVWIDPVVELPLETGRKFFLIPRSNGEVFLAYTGIQGYLDSTLLGILHSTDYGETWTYADTGLDRRIISFTFDHGGAAYANTVGGLYKSTDGCRSWIQVLDSSKLASLELGALYANSDGYLYSSGPFSYMSTDGGQTWDSSAFGSNPIISRSDTSHDSILVGTVPGREALIVNYCYNTFDNTGNCGYRVFQGHHDLGYSFVYGYPILSISPDGMCYQHQESTMNGSDFHGVRWSSDSGSIWNWSDDSAKLPSNLADPDANVILCDGSGITYLCSGLGVYRSTDHGRHWAAFMDSIQHADQNDIALSPDGTLYWYSDSMAYVYIYHTNVAPYSDVRNEQAPVSEMSIRVYPSVIIDDRATIEFSLINSSMITVEIVNECGSVVRTEFTGAQATGEHNLLLDLHGLPKGVLFVRIRTGAETAAEGVLHQ